MSGIILSEDQRKIILEIIELHEKMRGSYFWSPPQHAHERRYYEKKNSAEINFVTEDGTSIELTCETKCSCRNIYYKGHFFINGQRVTIKKIKSLLNNCGG